MLFYRTQHRHNPFPRSSSLSHRLLYSPSPRIQGMEFAQAGFKTGFEPETAAKTAAAGDDSYGVNGYGSGDDFFVDELLDFSNGFSETDEQPPPLTAEPSENEPEGRKFDPGSDETQAAPPENLSLSAGDDFGSLHESEISIQGEGLESLEWLSHFVEDSFPDYSLAGKFPQPTENRPKPVTATQERSCFVTPVQTKARTKRARTGFRVIRVLSASFAETSTSSSSSTSSTTSFSPPNKRRKGRAEGGGAVPPRRCTHCGVTKTPQWRAGPLGPKTLCNACGVRYKSGRLLPEYRPACSPTFSSELHSNNHRKVLEMRQKKEVVTTEAGGSEFLRAY